MKKILLSKDWSYPDILRQSPNHSGCWGNIVLTENNDEEHDYLVVLNRPHKNIRTNCDKKHRYIFMQEPPVAEYEWHKRSYSQFEYIFAFWNDEPNIISTQTCLPWHINKSYDELLHLEPESLHKSDEIAWITSNSRSRKGHVLRMELLDYLNEKGYPVNLYGRGFVPINDKFTALYPCKYSLAIENYSCRDYWTEKLTDSFLSWNMPIYWGATNITDYFPKESMILIDITDKEKSLEILKEAIANNLWEKNIEYIRESRDLILNKYQIFPFLNDLVNHNSNNNCIGSYIIKRNLPDGNLSGKLFSFLKNRMMGK
ncbi:glycosyltransferase family 10 domain-containing protein [Celerinatantimonas sp. MCCC 1A17872]|uniref:glycosyltransferase family 10 domain-containing protein n=1 Tax=Celerinatantimonas sp. MCCC 1A17872 TaxID=3177514 RepID=UPI0038C39BC0